MNASRRFDSAASFVFNYQHSQQNSCDGHDQMICDAMSLPVAHTACRTYFLHRPLFLSLLTAKSIYSGFCLLFFVYARSIWSPGVAVNNKWQNIFYWNWFISLFISCYLFFSFLLEHAINRDDVCKRDCRRPRKNFIFYWKIAFDKCQEALYWKNIWI